MTKEILDSQLPGKIVNAKHRKSIWITGARRLIVGLSIPNKRFLRGGEFRASCARRRILCDAKIAGLARFPIRLSLPGERAHRSMRTIALLTISNIFMTFAWYGHLKYRNVPLYKVILVSWLIAFFEYCFQVPANRIGSYEFSAVQLKTIQEVITLVVFSIFSVLYLGQSIRWNHVAGFAMIVGAVGLIFKQW
jgi:uncharacterized protein (DUF486 family)